MVSMCAAFVVMRVGGPLTQVLHLIFNPFRDIFIKYFTALYKVYLPSFC